MKNCSNHKPDCKILNFSENSTRKNIYNLIQKENVPFNKFNFFRLETPRSKYLHDKGVKYVLESWENGLKILHTGLIETGIKNYYVGDYVEIIKDVKKTSLMIVFLDPETSAIKIYFFNQYNKKSLLMKLQFCKSYINSFIINSNSN